MKINNFKNNNIDYSLNKIKNLLQFVREADILKDYIFLSNIKNISINFEGKDKNEDNVPYCLSKGEIINIRYSNSNEKYIILTTLYQIKEMADCDD